MCDSSNNLSFKERVQYYINKRDEIIDDYKKRINALEEEANADILANCHIKVGDVYVSKHNNDLSNKQQYYRIAKLEVSINGNVCAYGNKINLNGSWSKRCNFIFIAFMLDDYSVNNYIKVENYVEPTKD